MLIRSGADSVKLEGGRVRRRGRARAARRADPGDGPPRPHAAERYGLRRIQGPGQDHGERQAADRGRAAPPGRGRLRRRDRGRAERRGQVRHRGARYSRPSASAPAPTPTVRCSSSTICSGLTNRPPAKFVRQYADLGPVITEAIASLRRGRAQRGASRTRMRPTPNPEDSSSSPFRRCGLGLSFPQAWGSATYPALFSAEPGRAGPEGKEIGHEAL